MHHPEGIRSVQQLVGEHAIDLPADPGIYAFWWIGERDQLLAANRRIILKGPSKQPVEVEYRD